MGTKRGKVIMFRGRMSFATHSSNFLGTFSPFPFPKREKLAKETGKEKDQKKERAGVQGEGQSFNVFAYMALYL